MNKDYYPGKGCQCYAHSESECTCTDVDWTDPEVYELRDEVKSLEESVKVLTDDRNRWHELFEEGVKQQRVVEDELKKWKESIEEQIEICGLNTIEYKDPKEALYHLVHYQMEGAYNEGVKVSGWKDAVMDELICWYIYKNEHENNPKKAVHDLIVLHSEVAVDLYKRDRWHRRAWDKIRSIWYDGPIAYKLWKICGNKQPPF